MVVRSGLPSALLAGTLMLAACTTGTAEDRRAGDGVRSSGPPAAGSPSPTSTTSSGSPPSTPSGSPSSIPERRKRTTPRPHPVSLPALFDKRYDGRGLTLRGVVARTDAYTSHAVTYRSGDLTVSGLLNVPNGRGQFPALVLAHGYIDPAYYANGQGLRREQDWLARAGYVVLHTDYRNHAGSSDDPTADRRMRLGYTVDTINAVLALRRTRQLPVDDDRVGLLGRSMGGGVVYNVLVTAPGLVDAAVVFAPVSSRTSDNFNRWIRDDPGRSGLSDFILRRYGEPSQRPRFWRQVSPRTYFERITEPVLIHHGTADESCPIRWSRTTTAAMKAAGVDVRMHTYPGEPHAFVGDWPLSMRRSVAFFRRHL